MSQDPMAFARHDHDSCISVALTAADAACAARKVRMTPVRRRVLEILLESHSALGAYDVLARLDASEATLRLEEVDAAQTMLLAGIARLEAEIVMIRGRAESRVASAKARLTEMTAGQELYEHELAFAKADYDRARALAASGTISSARLERSHTDYLTARQELSRARAEIAIAEAGIDEANAELAEV